MTTIREHSQAGTGGVIAARLTSEQVWRALTRASFAVVSYVTPAGEPRSSGVVYAADGQRLYVAVAAGSWKARHIAAHRRVAVTVPVRRGGIMSLLLPIPPATISFHASAAVHTAESPQGQRALETLAHLLPPRAAGHQPRHRNPSRRPVHDLPGGRAGHADAPLELARARVPVT